MRGCPTVSPDRQGREEEDREGGRDVEELEPPAEVQEAEVTGDGGLWVPLG